jgi:hypothetical protein
LNQTGGNFLPFLIPPVLSVLASLISKKLWNTVGRCF